MGDFLGYGHIFSNSIYFSNPVTSVLKFFLMKSKQKITQKTKQTGIKAETKVILEEIF